MVTDFVQFLMIIIGVLIVVPWAVISAGGISAEMSTGMSAGGTAENMSTTAPEGITGSAITGLSVVNGVSVVNGLSAVSEGLGGASGRFRNIFDPGVAFSFGIVTAIGLISGAISDQQYWQRAFAIKKKNLVKSFVFGAVMFGIVPIIISSLGFLAANNSFANAVGITLPEGADASMIGVVAVSKLLPPVGAAIFVLMLLGALCSTMDSGLSATSSLYVIDVVRYKKEQTDVLKKFDEGKAHLLSDDERKEFKRVSRKGVWNSRISMIAITLLGFGVALAANYVPGFGLKHLWWIFNTVAACVVVPTLLSLYWKRLDAKGVFWGVLISFVVGVPLFVYGNIINNSLWIVGSSLFIIGISTLCCLIMPKARSKENIREQDSASS
jgi:Na+/proline symporter